MNSKLTITRNTNGAAVDMITIEIRRPDGTRIRGEVTLEDFAMVITGRADVPIIIDRDHPHKDLMSVAVDFQKGFRAYKETDYAWLRALYAKTCDVLSNLGYRGEP